MSELEVGTIAGGSGETFRGKFLDVDGLRTHYFDEGEGPTILLLHGGEFGCAAELSWEFMLPELVKTHRVIAPDWLGFGRTAKVHDFESGSTRRALHLRRFIELMGIDSADIVGSSMGGTNAAKMLGADMSSLPARTLTLIGAGGLSPDNEARRKLTDYDCSRESMRELLWALFHSPRWYDDDAYIDKRWKVSLLPGAWEATAAARFKNPQVQMGPEFGHADALRYEELKLPVFLIAGAQDKLKPVGYAEEIAQRLPDPHVSVFEECGHSANIEQAERTIEALRAFIDRD